MTVQIEVISDVVCPWCFIGKRRLEAALRQLRERSDPPEVTVSWQPFQLNPDLPAAGMARAEYVQRKFGGSARQIYQRVASVGESVGIAFAFERIARQPNTLPAHQLIALAATGNQDAMVEQLFRAYFLEGADLTRPEVLIALAAEAGVEREAARAALEDPAMQRAVSEQEAAARAMGVEGVPFFVFDRRLAISGAHEPEMLVRAIEQAAASAG
ncbi:MAG: DsbA family oxidoreductase [Burkholderiales bacterium]|nr:DsbA family oxidoreductase [Burkholderiales bacterium]